MFKIWKRIKRQLDTRILSPSSSSNPLHSTRQIFFLLRITGKHFCLKFDLLSIQNLKILYLKLHFYKRMICYCYQAEGTTEKDDANVPDTLTSTTTFTAKVVSDVVRLDGLDLPTLGKSDEDDVTFPAFDENPSLTFGSESVIISRNVIPGQLQNNLTVTNSDKGPNTFAESESERTDQGCKPVSCNGCREDFNSQSEYLEHLNKVHRYRVPMKSCQISRTFHIAFFLCIAVNTF